MKETTLLLYGKFDPKQIQENLSNVLNGLNVKAKTIQIPISIDSTQLSKVEQQISSLQKNMQVQMSDQNIIKQLNTDLAALNAKSPQYKQNMENIATQYKNISNEANPAAKNISSFGNTLKEVFVKGPAYLLGFEALFKTFELLKESLVDVEVGAKGLSTVLPELAHDQNAYNKATEDTINLMQKYGSSLDDTMTAARSFGRMYKNISTIMGLTNNAILLNVIDQVALEDSTKANEAALATYGQTLKSTNDILAFSGKLMDSITNLSHNTLATGTDLVNILTQSSGAAKNAKVSIDELLGLGAASVGSTGMQGQGGNLGRALRTVFSNLTVPTKDVEKAIGDVGVNMRKTNGELRDAYDIILDLSLATKDATISTEDMSKAIEDAASGKFQYNKFAALVGSFDKIVKDTALSISSEGKTMEMAGQQMDTISRKTGQLKATMIDLFNSAADSGLRNSIKDIIDGIDQFMMGLKQVNPAIYQFGFQLMEAVIIGKTFMAVYGVLTPLLTTAGTAMEALGIVTKVEAVATAEAAAAQEALNLSMIKSPIGLIITGLSALAGMALYQYISKLGDAEKAQLDLNQAQQDEIQIATQKASQANITISYLETLKNKHKELSDAINRNKLNQEELTEAQKNLQAVDESILILTDTKTREQLKANGVSEEEINLVIQSAQKQKEAAISKMEDQKKLTDITIQETLNRIKALEAENALWQQMAANKSPDKASFLSADKIQNSSNGFLGAIDAENKALEEQQKKSDDLAISIINAKGQLEEFQHDASDTGENNGVSFSSSNNPIEHLDTTKSQVEGYNYLVDEDNIKEKLLEKETTTADKAKDHTKEISLQMIF